MKVCVLMSTYNGEKFLSEQIETILNQTGVEVNLHIRDDGSNDRTKEILKTYAEKYDNVNITFGEAAGVGKSFMSLLYSAEPADYYAFSDQDDIWDADKLWSAIQYIKEKAKITDPVLYCGNQKIVDSDRKFVALRLPENYEDHGLMGGILANGYAGCTMVMNHILWELLQDKKRRPKMQFFDSRIHDEWIVAVAQAVGKVIYDPVSHMEYRHHNSAFTSTDSLTSQKKYYKFKFYVKKIRQIKNRGFHKNGMRLTAENLLKFYPEFLNNDEKRKLLIMANYKKSMKNKVALLRSNMIRECVKVNPEILIVRILLGVF